MIIRPSANGIGTLASCAMLALAGSAFDGAISPAAAQFVCAGSADGNDPTGGAGAVAAAGTTTACGNVAAATGADATAIGNSAGATRAGTTAVGSSAFAVGTNATAIGFDVIAGGQIPAGIFSAADTTAIGHGARAGVSVPGATEPGATAVGASAAAEFGGTALGYKASALNAGTALGGGSRAIGESAIAIGSASAYGNSSFAAGVRSVAATSSSVALGSDAAAGTAFAPANGVPLSFANVGTTAIGSGAKAGAGADGQTNATAVGQNATANMMNASAFGQGASATATGAVALGMGSVADVANTVSIGKAGAERKLANLAPGTIANNSTDAINGGQLFTANQRVANAFGGGAGLDANGQLTAPSYTIQGTNFTSVGGAFTAIDSVITMQNANGAALATQVGMNTTNIANINTTGTKYYQSNSAGPAASATGADSLAMGLGATSSGANAIATGTGAQATQAGAIAIGMNSASTGKNAIAIGTGASATGSVAVGAGASAANGGAALGDGAVATATNATAVGPGATAKHANAVAVGSGSVTSAPNTVSVGSVGNERRITNVAAGVNQTDAVNMSQLSSIAGGFQSQIGSLQNQVNYNRSEARDGIAVALASGGSPALQPGRKFAISANVGTFEGASAFAAGVTALLTDTKQYAVVANGSVGVGFNTNTVGGRGGVSLQW